MKHAVSEHSCGCCSCAAVTEMHHDLNHEEMAHNHKHAWFSERLIWIIGSVFFLVIAALFDWQPTIKLVLFIISYLLVGMEILIKAIRNLIHGDFFDENFLMSIATIGAFVIGEYLEAVAVMLFFQIGEYLQDLAVNRSRRSISAVLNIRPDQAHKQLGDEIVTVSPDSVNIGDLIVVKAGERIPLDGVVVQGSSSVDTSVLTGEVVPREIQVGDQVFSGTINLSGLLTVKVTKTYTESTASKIIELVQNAASKKAPTENFIRKFAKYYTPTVVFGALALALIPPLVIPSASFSEWSYRALLFLIISCPCALVVSIPLSFFGGIGAASRHGILVKGSNYLEALNDIDTIAFDKTGTLTQGKFAVTKVVAVNAPQEKVLEYAAYAESFSNHPIAVSIRNAYQQPIDQSRITAYNEQAGYGITATINGDQVIVGSSKLLQQHNIDHPSVNIAGSVAYVAVNNQYLGHILIADQVKTDSTAALQMLRQMGVKNFALLSGDTHQHAAAIGDELGINQIYAELLPQDKVGIVEQLQTQTKKKLAFVGDGINDAPVLARADVGIAMGGLGSDAAIEAADVVLMTDEVSKLATGMKVAKYTRKIAWQNIILALGTKALFLILGAFGIAGLWEAIFADVGVTLLAVINASRVLAVKFD